MTIAVLVILITAPIGAIAIAISGPKFLKKENKSIIIADDVDSEQEQGGVKNFLLNCFSK